MKREFLVNIVVCAKAVPTNVAIPVPSADGAAIVHEGDRFMNGSDEYALEQALLLKNAHGGRVMVISVGGIKSQDILHIAIAKGADDALRIDSDEFDPNVVSLLLARAISGHEFDLVLTGVESADCMASQVPVSIAAHLRMPAVYAVTKIEAHDAPSLLRVTRELGGGRYQVLEVVAPVLLCVQSGIVPLTYTPAVKLIHARRRAVPTASPDSFGVSSDELSSRRKTRVKEIKPVDRSSATQWLTGNPSELATQIIERITGAL